MVPIPNTKPERLFTFGCSFTHYRWASWANILAYELGCEFYNFGKSGAGNSYIANQITQANNYFGFTKRDLIVVCWTNISREDRWTDATGWITPGNIYTQGEYDTKFIKQWANDIHFALRDFAAIDLVNKYLDCETNYVFLSMCDITRHINQWENTDIHADTRLHSISNLYKNSLNKIQPSFYDTLWNGDINSKWKKDWKEIHPHFSDGHPMIKEHLQYLQSTFDYKFSKKTKNSVMQLDKEWQNFIRQGYKNTKRTKGIHDMPQDWQETMFENFRLKRESPIPDAIFH